MNKAEYAEYEAAVAAFFEHEGINCLSLTDPEQEGYFSWRPCDCCGSPKGGDRYDYSGYNPELGEVLQGYEICVDCLYYVTYGRLDDMTRLEIEESDQCTV